ncbi:uncharacterized protein LOC105356973 isoform X2 [Oryzias latipes]|uniref:uncharacterized protein LOC105356973 isoform X2 n=1 Tax=Oryzias latipes TaxID=8090 RepID=UPI0009DB3F6F|nr:uncharacterized protein LOC105356973 isoform X2 [Oryzias latipes]
MGTCFRKKMGFKSGKRSLEKDGRRPLIEDDDCDLPDVCCPTPVRSPQQDPQLPKEALEEKVRRFLNEALQIDRSQSCCSEEGYVRLYVDIIQVIKGAEARDGVAPVCYKELLLFVKRYKQEQVKELKNKTRTWKKNRETCETIDFLKTLKTCKELRLYIQTTAGRIPRPLSGETVAELEDMETCTMKLLMDVIADMAESRLKDYFRSAQKWLLLLTDLENIFPKRPYAADEQKLVIDKAYEIIVQSYLRCLLQNSRSRLKCWSEKLGPAISLDAHRLHQTMENLAPGVPERKEILLRIPEVLECGDNDGLRLTVALMKQDLCQHNVDLDLLPKLLRWKGHSRVEVKEVLDALADAADGVPPQSWWRRLSCCVSVCCQP